MIRRVRINTDSGASMESSSVSYAISKTKSENDIVDNVTPGQSIV